MKGSEDIESSQLSDSSVISSMEIKVSVEDAMRELASPKLKLLLFGFINLVYNFNSIFVGAIPFISALPDKLPVDDLQKPGTRILMKREEACELYNNQDINYRVILDDKYNHSDHYHNPMTKLGLQCSDNTVTLLIFGAFLANWGGQLVFNMLGDKYGRKTMSMFGSLATAFAYVLLMLPYSVSLLFVYLAGIGFMNAYFLQSYILGVEITTAENRDFFMCTNQALDGIMGMIPIIIFSLQDSTFLFLLAGLLAGLFVNVILFFKVPESIRFYLVHKKDHKAHAVLMEYAKYTGKPELIEKYKYVKLDDGTENEQE